MPSTQRIALITGGNRGIGRATAHALAADGVDSVITYRTHREEAEAVVAELEGRGRKAAAIRLDTGRSAEFDAFLATFTDRLRDVWRRDTFDHLINNAGNSSATGFAEMTEEEFDRLVDIHFKGVFFLTQKLADRLADNGSIVNISSGLARMSMPKRIAYGSVKGAVEVMTRYMALELGPRGIRANVVAPGAVATDFSGGIVRDTPAFQQQIAEHTALGRHAVADDIGPVIAAILSDANHWVTGQRIEASGGVGI
ncbi:MAG TPA: SDR family oxidoreductase [Solirubrobacterales bacterium]|nr:SDR family oxidoreductase [Solirubrobacterales bacterium]